MSETFTQGMPSAIDFGRIARGCHERPQIKLGREGNVEVYPWQAGWKRLFCNRCGCWRRLAWAHGCLRFRRGFADRLAARHWLSLPAAAKMAAFENRIELLGQPSRSPQSSRECGKSIEK